MKKLIIGIVAIICLDIGFILSRSSAPEGEVASVNLEKTGSVATAPPVEAPVPVANDQPSAPAAAKVDEIASRASIPVRKSITVQHRARSKSHSRNVARHRRTPSGPKFQDTTILYAVHKPIELKTANPPAAGGVTERSQLPPKKAEAEPKKPNRSFIARAIPIVKKPYDWIKALATKIF
jgi:hypothetical protein